MSRILMALDLETVIDVDLVRRIHPEPTEGLDDARVREALRQYTLAKTEGRSDFPKPLYWRVVAVGVAVHRAGHSTQSASRSGPNERELLTWVVEWFARTPGPFLATFNGQGFDLPVLRARMMHHLVPAPALFGAVKNWEKYDNRFSDVAADLAEVFSGYGASARPTLHEAAVLCGFSGKGDVSGADVQGLVDAERWGALGSYVEGDALQTLGILLRWLTVKGQYKEVEQVEAPL